MDFFRRFFSRTPANEYALNVPHPIQLGEESVPGVYVRHDAPPLNVLKLLEIGGLPRPAIFITGGAGNMSAQDKQLTRDIFDKGIAPFAEKYQAVVIDGATESGVIEMMAYARKKGRYTFPLIGIAPYSQVVYNQRENPDGYPLCPGHSHFAFVTGDGYGAESEMIISMTHQLAGGHLNSPKRVAPAVGILINGGQIARSEADMATTDALKLPLVVLEGSGRFADELATASRTGESSQPLLRAIIARADITLVGTSHGAGVMRATLQAIFDR
jgi:hypothetical protein